MKSEAIVSILAALSVGLAFIFVLLGWIVPLVMGRRTRRHGEPGHRGWFVLSAIWGGVALVLAVAAAGTFLMFSGFRSRSYGVDPKAPIFSAANSKEPIGTLKLAGNGEAELCASRNGKSVTRFMGSNGVMMVLAGTLSINSFKAVARGKDGQNWTALARLYGATNLIVNAGDVQRAPFGPPFSAGIRATWAGASDEISLSPVYLDVCGNEYVLSCEPRSSDVPEFEVLDSGDHVVWSGKFEYG
jgi:hypothetical protein